MKDDGLYPYHHSNKLSHLKVSVPINDSFSLSLSLRFFLILLQHESCFRMDHPTIRPSFLCRNLHGSICPSFFFVAATRFVHECVCVSREGGWFLEGPHSHEYPRYYDGSVSLDSLSSLCHECLWQCSSSHIFLFHFLLHFLSIGIIITKYWLPHEY